MSGDWTHSCSSWADGQWSQVLRLLTCCPQQIQSVEPWADSCRPLMAPDALPLPDGFRRRRLELADFHRGYLQLLSLLSPVPATPEEAWQGRGPGWLCCRELFLAGTEALRSLAQAPSRTPPAWAASTGWRSSRARPASMAALLGLQGGGGGLRLPRCRRLHRAAGGHWHAADGAQVLQGLHQGEAQGGRETQGASRPGMAAGLRLPQVGHIEDVVVSAAYRKRNFGSM